MATRFTYTQVPWRLVRLRSHGRRRRLVRRILGASLVALIAAHAGEAGAVRPVPPAWTHPASSGRHYWQPVSAAFVWTTLPSAPTAGGNMIYVDPDRPDDSGDGTSPETAKKTIQAGYNALVDNAGSILGLKRGGVWTDERLGATSGGWRKSGADAQNPIWVIPYGDESDPRPLIRTGTLDAIAADVGGAQTVKHVRFVSIDCLAHTRDPDSEEFDEDSLEAAPSGVRFQKECEDLLFEDCRWRYYNQCWIAPDRSSDPDRVITNVRFRRCVFDHCFTDPSSGDPDGSGLYVQDLVGLLLEECVFWHNGWHEQYIQLTDNQARRNRDLYLGYSTGDIIVRGCISADGCSGGLQVRPGGVIERNLSLRNPVGISLGHSQNPTVVGGTVRHNVVLGGRDVQSVEDGAGPTGWGFSFEVKTGPVEVYENIATMNALGTAAIGMRFGDSSGGTTTYADWDVHHNIIYRWDAGGAGAGVYFASPQNTRTGSIFDGFAFRDNVIYQADGGFCLEAGASFTWAGTATCATNTWVSANASGSQHFYGNQNRSTAQLAAITGETEYSTSAPSWPDPDRTIDTYMASIGRSGDGLDEFMSAAVENRKGAWDDRYTALAVIDYIREGFGLEPLGEGGGGEPEPEPEPRRRAVVAGGVFLPREVA